MTDVELIRSRLGEIDRLIAGLEKRIPVSSDDLLGSLDLSLIVERSLERAVQSVLDISAHILADRGMNRAEDYTMIIMGLGEAGVISAELARRIRPMAGLRNILVHEYLHLDPKRIALFVNTQLGDFRDFAAEIELFLNRP